MSTKSSSTVSPDTCAPVPQIRVLLRRRPDLQKPLLQLLTRDLLMKAFGETCFQLLL